MIEFLRKLLIQFCVRPPLTPFSQIKLQIANFEFYFGIPNRSFRSLNHYKNTGSVIFRDSLYSDCCFHFLAEQKAMIL